MNKLRRKPGKRGLDGILVPGNHIYSSCLVHRLFPSQHGTLGYSKPCSFRQTQVGHMGKSSQLISRPSSCSCCANFASSSSTKNRQEILSAGGSQRPSILGVGITTGRCEGQGLRADRKKELQSNGSNGIVVGVVSGTRALLSMGDSDDTC